MACGGVYCGRLAASYSFAFHHQTQVESEICSQQEPHADSEHSHDLLEQSKHYFENHGHREMYEQQDHHAQICILSVSCISRKNGEDTVIMLASSQEKISYWQPYLQLIIVGRPSRRTNETHPSLHKWSACCWSTCNKKLATEKIPAALLAKPLHTTSNHNIGGLWVKWTHFMATMVVLGCAEISLTTLCLAHGDLGPRRTCTMSLPKPANNNILCGEVGAHTKVES